MAIGSLRSVLEHMDLADLAIALDELPCEQREALILIGADGHSYSDAALLCGCAVGTVKSRVNRARAKLRELLQIEDVTLRSRLNQLTPGVFSI